MDRIESYERRPPVPGLRLLAGAVLGLALVLLARFLWFETGLFRSEAAPRPVTPRGDLAADEKATVELFERSSPSVVHITTKERQTDWLGRNVFEVPQGTGSGFLWDGEGHVVTNVHVIEGGDTADVTLSDQSTWRARFVGAAADKDIAVLRIDAPRGALRPLPVGTSGDLRVGQKVFAIGNPFGLDQTLTTGVISGLDREIRLESSRVIRGVIQTDAAVNPGNSGGPLLDSSGRLIGVNTAIHSPTGASVGIGFAVPVDTVNRLVPQIIRTGRVASPSLGIRILPDDSARRLGVEGVPIGEVVRGSPAERAGLRGLQRVRGGRPRLGDVIVGLDGKPIAGEKDLSLALDDHAVGDTVTIRVLRGNSTVDVSVTLAAME